MKRKIEVRKRENRLAKQRKIQGLGKRGKSKETLDKRDYPKHIENFTKESPLPTLTKDGWNN